MKGTGALVGCVVVALACQAAAVECPEGAGPHSRNVGGAWLDEWCELAIEGEVVRHGPYESSWLPDMKPRMEGAYQRGQRTGRWRSWYRSGQPSSETTFRTGESHGASLKWVPDGSLRSAGHVRNGERYGTWLSYHENGQLAREENYKAGELTGVFRSWYEDGQPRQIGEYASGEQSGHWTTYTPEGEIKAEGEASAVEKAGQTEATPMPRVFE